MQWILEVESGDSFSFTFSSVQGGDDWKQPSQRPPAALTPPAAAKSPSGSIGSPVPAERTTWKSQAGPPPDLKWSPTIERLIMNSTKQVAIDVHCEAGLLPADGHFSIQFS